MPSLPFSTTCLILALAAPVAGQLADLQPGRNFPTAADDFGNGRSENIDVGDVDNDGDWDVGVANGGDGAPQANVIYINQGGLQAGVEGAFVDESAARFAGLPNDTSRDVDFADFEGDGDLDIAISNRGNSINGGEVSRAYINRGGAQAGTIGFFDEGTDAFWGTLVSVPLSREEGVQDGAGPWRGWTRDMEFADLDDDGDLDVVVFTPGLNMNGVDETRVFLNDGAATFDELFPWADIDADIKLHTLDGDIADLDDDFDLDIVASSRDSQARVYRNNLDGASAWSGDPFTDVTRTALIDQGAGLTGSSNYEVEIGDLDGDGDFDLWMNNYASLGERVLRNRGNMIFAIATGWVRGDPGTDEQEVDLFDYDGDGDLDAFLPNFSGTNYLYQNGLAQGFGDAEGLFHRTGTTTNGSMSPEPETPDLDNSGTTLDGECADLDGDGDTDLILCNDLNLVNKRWVNDLGVPDTHAPAVHQMTVQGDKADGTDTVIIAQVRDNHALYVINAHDARLVYSVDGAPEVCLKMMSQGGQQFRGVIPGGIDGSISYRVEVTDHAGNTGVSATESYVQTSSGVVLWESLDCGTPGVYGRPDLAGSGPLTGGSIALLNLTDAAPGATAGLFLSAVSTPAPFKGGTLYAFPGVLVFVTTDSGGQIYLPLPWPAGLPTGGKLWWQYAVQDGTAQGGVSVSNAVVSTLP